MSSTVTAAQEIACNLRDWGGVRGKGNVLAFCSDKKANVVEPANCGWPIGRDQGCSTAACGLAVHRAQDSQTDDGGAACHGGDYPEKSAVAHLFQEGRQEQWGRNTAHQTSGDDRRGHARVFPHLARGRDVRTGKEHTRT